MDMPESHPAASPFWAPHLHADRRSVLLARGRIVAALRAWFAADGFIEVETGALQVSPGNETHLHAFATDARGSGWRRDRAVICAPRRNSPARSFSLPASGGSLSLPECSAIASAGRYTIRNSPLLEWYRAGEPYETLMADCAAILALAAKAAGTRELTFRGLSADPFAEPERLTVAEAFTRFAGIDLLATLSGGEPDRDGFLRAARAADIRVGDDDTWGDIFSRVLVEQIEPPTWRWPRDHP